MVQDRLPDGSLPREPLHFGSQAYSLDCMSSCDADADTASITLPTMDFAMFLIESVRFHYGQLFHLFDEQSFMQEFGAFHRGTRNANTKPDLWFVHYLLLLALGTAAQGGYRQGTKPPGANFFSRSMRVVPHLALASEDPLESIEILTCAAIYLQSLHKRQAAYNLVSLVLFACSGALTYVDCRLDRRCASRCSKVCTRTCVIDAALKLSKNDAALLGGPHTC